MKKIKKSLPGTKKIIVPIEEQCDIYPPPQKNMGGDRNRPKLKSSHLQIGLVGGEGKVIDENRGQTRGVLQSHMEEYGIRKSLRAITKKIAFLEQAQKVPQRSITLSLKEA